MARIALILAIFGIGFQASAKVISNVTVCAVACNGELEEQTDVDDAEAGTVYFAAYNKKNSKSPATCMKHARHLPTYEFKPADQEEIAQKGCSQILEERFFGKKVDIVISGSEKEASLPHVTEIIIR